MLSAQTQTYCLHQNVQRTVQVYIHVQVHEYCVRVLQLYKNVNIARESVMIFAWASVVFLIIE